MVSFQKPSTNPGPANYSPPSLFPEGPKHTILNRPHEPQHGRDPKIQTLPSTLRKSYACFGQRIPSPPPYVTPAPSLIHEPPGVRSQKSHIGERHTVKQDDFPGPGQYDVSRSLSNLQFSIRTGQRTPVENNNLIVPPGVYDIPVLFQETKQFTIHPLIPIPEPERNGPGPAYDVSYQMGTDTPHNSIHNSYEFKPKEGPSPDAYTISRDIQNPSSIKFRFKGRPPLPRGDITDYPYQNIGGTITPKMVHHGIRPKTNYETISPGPIYNKPGAIERKSITIGVRTSQKDPNRNNPPPDRYFQEPIPPRDNGSFSFRGSTDRCLVNTEKEKEKPGPADYRIKGQFEDPKGGFTFNSRKMEQYTPDTAAPYQRQFSSFEDGHKFTIGLKDAW